jgi:haloalkane dehalogenase
MPEAVRTPEERFEGLPDFDYEPHYRELEGLRLAHLDEGDGAPVVFLHGEPTWSFLWRKVFPPVRAAGYRCIVPDLAGFGRSDKPVDDGWYTYDRHTALVASLLEELDLREATLVVHDWGGPIGLRVAVEDRERVTRMVAMDTGVFNGRQRMTDAWYRFRDFVAANPDLPVGMLVRNACHVDPGEEVVAAYEAPFPDQASKAGARAFPAILPTRPADPGAEAGQRTLEALTADERPMLVLWADSDPVLPPDAGRGFTDALGRDRPRIVEGASHFLQEDRGEEIGRLIADWLASP